MILLISLLTGLSNCTNNQEQKKEQKINPIKIVRTTDFQTKDRISYKYIAIDKGDTLNLVLYFTKDYATQKVNCVFRFFNYSKVGSTENILAQAKTIMKEAHTDLNLMKMNRVGLQNLESYGAISSDLFKCFSKKFPDKKAITTKDYDLVEQLLLESSLTEGLNTLCKPYSVKVMNYQVEKAYIAHGDKQNENRISCLALALLINDNNPN